MAEAISANRLNKSMKLTFKTLLLILLGAGFQTALAQTPASQDDASRQIVLDRFNKARPSSTATGATGGKPNATVARRPVYRRTGSLRTPGSRQRTPVEEIGVTVWRLRPARSSDEGGRLLGLDGAQQTQFTPERIEADTPLNIGDRVRITVESPRQGFLYIIDREQYADGTLGEAMLIFPTRHTRGGDNRVEPGKLIDIPAQEDQYSYFTAQPGRSDQVAEVLTIIVVPQALPLQIGDRPLRISAQELAGWEKLWGGEAERLELVGGAGRTWTNEEKLAGAANGRQLTQGDPPPQTVYRVARRTGGPFLVTVPLRYVR